MIILSHKMWFANLTNPIFRISWWYSFVDVFGRIASTIHLEKIFATPMWRHSSSYVPIKGRSFKFWIYLPSLMLSRVSKPDHNLESLVLSIVFSDCFVQVLGLFLQIIQFLSGFFAFLSCNYPLNISKVDPVILSNILDKLFGQLFLELLRFHLFFLLSSILNFGLFDDWVQFLEFLRTLNRLIDR